MSWLIRLTLFIGGLLLLASCGYGAYAYGELSFAEGYHAGYDYGQGTGYSAAEAKYENTLRRVELPRHFSSLDELESWLEEDNADTYDYVQSGFFDCDDFARILQAHALADGYILSFHIDEITPTKWHAVNLAVIGNEVYLIDPQTDAVTFYCTLD